MTVIVERTRRPETTLARGLGIGAAVVGVASLALAMSFGSSSVGRLWPVLIASAANSFLIALVVPFLVRRNALGIDTFTLFLAIAFVAGSVVPLANAVLGAPVLTNRSTAGAEGATIAAWLQVCFTAAVCAGWLVAAKVREKGAGGTGPATPASPSMVGALLVLGLMGLALRFPSPGALIGFVSGDYASITGGPQGVVGFVSSATRPMLAIGTFCLFRRTRGPGRVAVAAVLAPMSALALLSFSLNRASLLFCALALLLVALRGRDRGSLVRLTVVAAIGGLVFLAIGGFRTGLFVSQGGRYDVDVAQSSWSDEVNKSLSVYAQSPFYVGVVFDDLVSVDLPPGTILASLLGPIPNVGEGFRTESGTARYNQAIYGTTGVQDQILPIYAELFLVAGLGTLVIGGIGIGVVIARLDLVRERVSGEVPAYALTLAGIWLAQASIVSLQILSQIFWFFLAPLLALSLLLPAHPPTGSRLPRRRSTGS